MTSTQREKSIKANCGTSTMSMVLMMTMISKKLRASRVAIGIRKPLLPAGSFLCKRFLRVASDTFAMTVYNAA